MKTAHAWIGFIPLFFTVSSIAGSGPDDPFFRQQWSLHNDGTQTVMIDADNLHTIAQKGVAGVDIGWLEAMDELAGQASAPVTVAVIDSGIDLKHPDLQGRVLSDGWDFLTGTPLVSDDLGHGTHVSGIIAANSGNSAGIAGIAPASVKILPLRILSKTFTKFVFNGKFVSDYAADAIRYAVAHGASIINMSLGWPKVANTANVRDAVNEAIQKGVLIVVAAGNDRKDAPTYPCAFEGVLCVGSITNTGAMAAYSNTGGLVDLLAPGDGIVSLFPSGVESSTLRIQGYEMLSGTSQATPHVTAMAATIKSLYPGISLNELKARLLVSTKTLPATGAALYGAVNLKAALDASPRPVFVPNFKTTEGAVLDEATLKIQGSISVQNLWSPASGVQAQIRINGKAAGSAQAPVLASGAWLGVPWTYAFSSLEDSSEVELTLRLSATGMASQDFSVHLFAARPMQSLSNRRVIPLPSDPSWIGNINGQLFSRLNIVSSMPQETGFPRYYQQLGAGPAGASVQILDPAASPQVFAVNVPAIQKVTQVIRLDMRGDGTMDWVITGIAGTQAQPVFEFYFLGPDFKPLWGGDANSTWQVSLTTPLGQTLVRDYAAPNSWLRSGDKLLPCLLTQGQLPDPDNFNRLDPRRSKSDTHLFYLNPLPIAPGANVTALQLRALDNSDFHQKNPTLHLRSLIPNNGAHGEIGHLRLLMGMGDALDAQTLLWDVASLIHTSTTPAIGWDALSSSGQALQALSSDPSSNLPVYLSFFDNTRGSLSWASPQGQFQDRVEFSFQSSQNPITGLVGAFSIAGVGRVWFLESSFDLIAFHQGLGPSAPVVEHQTLPIERDSTFAGNQFSEMFTPVLVGNTSHPLPGVYIDSTLVRGDRLSVATWNSGNSRLEKPLRYSLQVPSYCVQMPPVRLDLSIESFALPLLCQQGTLTELWTVHPAQ